MLPPIIFPASASQSPFRVAFYRVAGLAIGYLLRGELTGKWQHVIPGQPYIVENEQFKFVQQLARPYIAPPNGSSAESEGTSPSFQSDWMTAKEEAELQALAAKQSGSSLFAGEFGSLEDKATSGELQSISNGAASGLIAEVSGADRQDLFFWRFARREDLSRFNDEPTLDSYRSITANGFPANFAPLTFYHHLCAGRWNVSMLTRELAMRVAVVENVSSQSLQIGSFSIKEHSTSELRTDDQDQQLLGLATPVPKQYFPSEVLKPGEELLIPLRVILYFAHDPDRTGITPFSDDISPDYRDKWLAEYGSEPYRIGGDYEGDEKYDMAPEVLQKYAASP